MFIEIRNKQEEVKFWLESISRVEKYRVQFTFCDRESRESTYVYNELLAKFYYLDGHKLKSFPKYLEIGLKHLAINKGVLYNG